MLAAVSIMDGTPARRDVHVRMLVSPEECNGHLGAHTQFINGGWWVDGRHWFERRQAASQDASTTSAFWA
jgi:hypothetical protein